MNLSSFEPSLFSHDLRLSCAQSGDPGGVPLVLLHGYTDSWRSFGPLMAALPPGIRVVAVSLRGHGDSEKPRLVYDVDLFAMDVATLLARLGIGRAFILGHSMGSLVAQRFALDWPERVAGLVLVGAFRTLKGNAAALDLWENGVAAMTDPVDPAFVAAFQRSTLAREVDPDFLDLVVAESRKAPAHVWRSALRAMLDQDSSHEIGRIAAPALVIWGARDAFASRVEQIGLVTALRDARLVTYPQAGHSPHWEEPRRAAADIADFIDGVEHAASAAPFDAAA